MIDLSTNFHLDRSNGWKVILSQTNRSEFVQNSFKAKTWASLCLDIYFIQVLIFHWCYSIPREPRQESWNPISVRCGSEQTPEGRLDLYWCDQTVCRGQWGLGGQTGNHWSLAGRHGKDYGWTEGCGTQVRNSNSSSNKLIIIEALQRDMAKIMDELKNVTPKCLGKFLSSPKSHCSLCGV